MKTYLVGGAVRDEILGLPVKEKDWMVTGGTVEQLISQGYLPVGKGFPVFLHPQTGEEYALARTEKKNGYGYGGFTFHTAADVTVEEDLYRRDLTINAIAKDAKGRFIDPYNGFADLKNRVLRHVSPAFVEDPLRVLRVARFAARFFKLGFSVAPETMELMRYIGLSGELNYLPPERIWQETLRALSTCSPSTYLETLYRCDALVLFFPELQENYESMECPPCCSMNKAAKEKQDSLVCFACGFVPWKICLKDSGECYQRVSLMVKRLKVPAKHAAVLLLVVRCLVDMISVEKTDTETLLVLLEQMDAFRRRERFFTIMSACDYLLSEAKKQRGQRIWLEEAALACQDIDIKSLVNLGFKGKQIAAEIRHARRQKIEAALTKS